MQLPTGRCQGSKNELDVSTCHASQEIQTPRMREAEVMGLLVTPRTGLRGPQHLESDFTKSLFQNGHPLRLDSDLPHKAHDAKSAGQNESVEVSLL